MITLLRSKNRLSLVKELNKEARKFNKKTQCLKFKKAFEKLTK